MEILFSLVILKSLDNSTICFIAVGTPMDEDGGADLQHVYDVAKEIGQLMNNDLIVVNKSTVPVGTAEKVKEIIDEEWIKEDFFKCTCSFQPRIFKRGYSCSRLHEAGKSHYWF